MLTIRWIKLDRSDPHCPVSFVSNAANQCAFTCSAGPPQNLTPHLQNLFDRFPHTLEMVPKLADAKICYTEVHTMRVHCEYIDNQVGNTKNIKLLDENIAST